MEKLEIRGEDFGEISVRGPSRIRNQVTTRCSERVEACGFADSSSI